MTNADKFLVAVQTGLLASQYKQKTVYVYAEKMLDAIKISERYSQDGFNPTEYALKMDVKAFLEWALLGTKHEWIESNLR